MKPGNPPAASSGRRIATMREGRCQFRQSNLEDKGTKFAEALLTTPYWP